MRAPFFSPDEYFMRPPPREAARALAHQDGPLGGAGGGWAAAPGAFWRVFGGAGGGAGGGGGRGGGGRGNGARGAAGPGGGAPRGAGWPPPTKNARGGAPPRPPRGTCTEVTRPAA